MKKIIGSAMLLLFTTAMYAQVNDSAQTRQQSEKQKPTPDQRALRKYRLLRSEISLDPQQAEKVKQIFIDFENRKETLITGSKEAREAVKKELKDLRSKTDQQLKDILGEEKFGIWEKIRKEKAEEHKSGKQKGN
jgi:hypothetical protein